MKNKAASVPVPTSAAVIDDQNPEASRGVVRLLRIENQPNKAFKRTRGSPRAA